MIVFEDKSVFKIVIGEVSRMGMFLSFGCFKFVLST